MKKDKKFELVVRAIIVDVKGNILLTKRAKKPEKGKWCLPGGKVEFGEDSQHAIIREIKEELNLFFNPQFLRFKDDAISVPNTHCHVMYFKGTITGKIHMQTDEIEKVTYFSREEIRKMGDIGFDHQTVLMKLL